MTTVGELLFNARIAKKISLEQVEKATKIRVRHLAALEQNRFDDLPSGAFVKGFVKNYASYLGLSVEEIMAFYRRQVKEKGPAPIIRKRPGLFAKFVITPQLLTAGIVTLFIAGFFGFLIFSYIRFAGAPPLLVDRPANNLVVHEDQIEVVGKTDPEASVTINNQPVSINENGSFEAKVPLSAGLNTLTIEAVNKFKRQTTVVRNLRLEK